MTSNEIKKGQKVMTKNGKPAIIWADKTNHGWKQDENGKVVTDFDFTYITIRSLRDGKPFGAMRAADITTITPIND